MEDGKLRGQVTTRVALGTCDPTVHREVIGPGNRLGGSRPFDGEWRRRLYPAVMVGFVLLVAVLWLFTDFFAGVRSPSAPKGQLGFDVGL